MKKITPDVLVAYASKYGSTEKIARWIGTEIRGNVDILNVENVNSLDYDYIILGTPIYEQELLPEMNDFIKRNKSKIKRKKKSAFVVTSDNENRAKKQHNIKALTKIIPGEINATAVLAGEINKNELNQTEVISVDSYLNSISKPIGSYSRLNEKKCREFGKSLNRFV